MHGRPRKPPTAAEQKTLTLKAYKIRSLQSQFLQFHHAKNYTKEALDINAKLLEANPEFNTAWNYRKLAVEHNLSQPEPLIDSDSINLILDEELRIIENALRKNYKSYGAWHHRKWVLSKGHSSTDREMKLLNMFQKQDSRNFHAWNYRRFIAALRNIPHEEELQFTQDMISDNFSNYSAWHNRSVLLSHLLKHRVQGYFPRENVLGEEYKRVLEAFFVDPDDQSGWFYHLWLLDQTIKLDNSLFVTSWPPHGFDIFGSINSSPDGCILPPLTSIQSNTRNFPLVLYFSEAVEGVNSTTVTVEAEYEAHSDLIWSPLSTNNKCAEAWVTNLNFPDEKHNSSKAYNIKVSLGCSSGIMSLSGMQYSNPSCIEFTVRIPPCDAQHAEGQSEERISWRDENFSMYESGTHGQESSPLNSFYRLRIREDNEPTASNWKAETIANEIAHFRELLSYLDCKIGKLTLARLLMAHDDMVFYNSPDALCVIHSEEVLELYRDLVKLDPPHSQYYEDMYSSVFIKQVTSSTESLSSYCRRFRHSTSSKIGDSLCLRLNNLSLSRIWCIERLLWVQMLDLSHNQLQSIQGLEAMQLLSCLNLSNNRLGSFCALDPLRLLKSLKVLDISYNEIGAHTIDTKRYLCSSSLSHTTGNTWNFKEFAMDGVEATNYWEAFTVFRGMNLIQLDILGNAFVSEKFKLFLSNLLPGLKWLDGKKSH